MRSLPSLLSATELDRVVERLGSGQSLFGLAELPARLRTFHLDAPLPARELGHAAEAVRLGAVSAYGERYFLAATDAASSDWHRDPRSGRRWPTAPHAELRLDDPTRPGDARMQWEPARFHQAILLALDAIVADAESTARLDWEALLAQVRSFREANPPFLGMHWAVGMEAGIRASAVILALQLFPHSRSNAAPAEIRMLVPWLLEHALFLEHHRERHPDGFTTNHTLAAATGLLLCARLFEGTRPAAGWASAAQADLRRCLEEQWLAGGAHAEASLAYERFSLETALVAALASEPVERERMRDPLLAMARHLRDASLGDGLPHVGDCDESFFPPFARFPYESRRPLDPSAVLSATARLFSAPDLCRPTTDDHAERTAGPEALWFGAAAAEPSADGVDQVSSARVPSGWTLHSGFARLDRPPFLGLLIHRCDELRWMRTHGHNDLLSCSLEIEGAPFLIDPGTGGYAATRTLRHELRRTAAHSTLELVGQEQSPLRPAALFEGPRPTAGGLALAPLGSALAWHSGYPGYRHERRVRVRGSRLVFSDCLAVERPGASEVETVLRFRLAPGLAPEVAADGRVARCAVEVKRRVGAVRVGTARLLLLHPRGARWQIASAPAPNRYGEERSAAVLAVRQVGIGPHRYRVAIDFEEAQR